MSKVVIDTDLLIDVLRGREEVRGFLRNLTSRSIPCCSVISVAELYAGMRPEEQLATDQLLDALVIVPVNEEIGKLAGRYKREARGRRLELADCLIAATAYMEDATLATGNVKDYPISDITVINPRT